MKNCKLLLGVLYLLAASGCATHSTLGNRPIGQDEVPRLIANSPHITKLTDRKFEKRTGPESIQLFYYLFHPLNRPDLVKNWEYHYVLAPASSPEWPHSRLAEVLVYLPIRDDKLAYEKFREVASSSGGDGVVDMHRKPIITQRPPAPIAAYLYFGVVVRKDN